MMFESSFRICLHTAQPWSNAPLSVPVAKENLTPRNIYLECVFSRRDPHLRSCPHGRSHAATQAVFDQRRSLLSGGVICRGRGEIPRRAPTSQILIPLNRCFGSCTSSFQAEQYKAYCSREWEFDPLKWFTELDVSCIDMLMSSHPSHPVLCPVPLLVAWYANQLRPALLAAPFVAFPSVATKSSPPGRILLPLEL